MDYLETMKVENETQAQIGEVWRNNVTNKVFVVRTEKSIENIKKGDYAKVADRAHENDDFSYLCGSDWCRCMQ